MSAVSAFEALSVATNELSGTDRIWHKLHPNYACESMPRRAATVRVYLWDVMFGHLAKRPSRGMCTPMSSVFASMLESGAWRGGVGATTQRGDKNTQGREHAGTRTRQKLDHCWPDAFQQQPDWRRTLRSLHALSRKLLAQELMHSGTPRAVQATSARPKVSTMIPPEGAWEPRT